MRKISKELYSTLDTQIIEIDQEKYDGRGLQIYLNNENKNAAHEVEKAGYIPYIITDENITENKIIEKEKTTTKQNKKKGINIQTMSKKQLIKYAKETFNTSLNHDLYLLLIIGIQMYIY